MEVEGGRGVTYQLSSPDNGGGGLLDGGGLFERGGFIEDLR